MKSGPSFWLRFGPLGAAIAILACALIGCAETDATEQQTGPLIYLGETRLAESDSLFIGKIRALAVDSAAGTFLVSDQFADRVVEYDRFGRSVRVVGHRGSGPGEISSVGIALTQDSMLWIQDNGRNTFNIYGRESGGYIRSLPYLGILTTVTRAGDTLVFGARNVTMAMSIARWYPGADSMTYAVPLPHEYLESNALAGIYTQVPVAVLDSVLIVGFSGLNRLLVTSLRGDVVDTIDVPVRVRRGVPDDVVAAMAGTSVEKMYELISALVYMHSLPSGELLLVHYDYTRRDRLMTARPFVTFIRPGWTTSAECIDIPMRASPDAQPRMAFAGDTMFVAEQTTSGQQVATTVARYLIVPRVCTFVRR